jgi:hypothetical protein
MEAVFLYGPETHETAGNGAQKTHQAFKALLLVKSTDGLTPFLRL